MTDTFVKSSQKVKITDQIEAAVIKLRAVVDEAGAMCRAEKGLRKE